MRMAVFVLSVALPSTGVTNLAMASTGYSTQTINDSPFWNVPADVKSALPERTFTRVLEYLSPIWLFAWHISFWTSVDGLPLRPVSEHDVVLPKLPTAPCRAASRVPCRNVMRLL